MRATDKSRQALNKLDWPAAVGFSLVPLAIGALAAQIGLSLPPSSPPWKYPAFWPPLWVFWSVWFLIYPTWGFATYLVWRRRAAADVRGAIALFVAAVVSGLFFMPVASLSGNNPGVMSMGDLNGVFSSWIFTWLYTRYDKRTLLFLVPLLIWMPVTLLLKLLYWHANT